MSILKTIPVFILLVTGYVCNAQDENKTLELSPAGEGEHHIIDPAESPGTEMHGSDPVPEGRSLPTLVVAGVSIALVLLCILIVAVFWYAWKKSQEGSLELRAEPCGDAAVSPRSQHEWPLDRAGQ